MSLLTHLNPNAIEDASIEGIKLKDGAVSASKIDETVASKKYVDDTIASAISASDAMVFKGTIGTGGTSESLPSTAIVGDTYKVISLTTIPDASSYTGAEETAKAGDLIVAISAEPKWIVVPSGDDEIKTLVQSIAWGDLKAKRDAGQLIPGMQYRITDYQCTTVQENTRSAGHQFDIIVTADDESTLNETARATKHEGDEYFANNDLNAWQIWYCIDNDITRFKWADAENGKGVIYRMIDEFHNDIPYDFKNIQFRRVDANTVTVIRGQYYANTDYPAKVEEFFNSTKNIIPFKYQYLEWYDSTEAVEGGFADLLGITDEELKSSSKYYCILDDKEWFGDPGLLASVESITDDNSKWIFTFNTNSFTDNSLDGYTNNVHSNEIGVCLTDGVMYLNNICFFGSDCYSNTFGSDCYSNTFGSDCYSNTFGSNCDYNTFGSNCDYNTFGSGCHYNTFGSNCRSNTFGSDCRNNTFGSNCDYNTFGPGCHYNTFGSNCDYNTFDSNCDYNTFGSNCDSNTFGPDCDNNTFGSNCSSNTFGSDCYSNTFGSNCSSNTFGSYCDNNTFGSYCSDNTFGSDCDNNTFGSYCDNNTFGSYCSDNVFVTDATGETPAAYFQRNRFESGVSYCILGNNTTAGATMCVQNYHLKSSATGTSENKRVIEVARNLAYDITVALNSEGTIKTYCEADLIR